MPRDIPAGSGLPSPNGRNGHIHSDVLDGLHLSDLIDRPAIAIDRAALRQYLHSRTVLVTGAGGSIGTELTGQLLDLDPKQLVLVDRNEHNLFQLERHLADSDSDIVLSLTDVRDRASMARLFDRTGPDLVIHAAAYKHVPLIERHPIAGFQNNTLATARLMEVCEGRAIEQLVLVSTDKAVEPRSVLGATKRLAEWIVRRLDGSLQPKIVRFGNVFGSRGSVIPLFAEQLAAGGPLKVTHPDMQRYFMSAPDACRLILQTLLLDEAPIYALKMGDPIRIEWLARQILQRVRPDADPASMITFTGRRPGEKLHEQLVAPSETAHSTAHAHINGVSGSTAPPHEQLMLLLEQLTHYAETDAAALRDALLEPVDHLV